MFISVVMIFLVFLLNSIGMFIITNMNAYAVYMCVASIGFVIYIALLYNIMVFISIIIDVIIEYALVSIIVLI